MPTWSGILNELAASAQKTGVPDFDGIRRTYLKKLTEHTGRETILYATKFTQPGNVPPVLVTIGDEDLQGLMEVIHGLKGPNLDLILHSPGGSAEAAESLVLYMRSKFEHIRVIVPHLAQSAATMIACASNEVVMGKHSYLGPIDPQVRVETALGPRSVPAQAVLDQFAMAVKACEDPSKMGPWMPMLGQYGPDLLVVCENASRMSEELVGKWLKEYMFSGDADGSEKALKLAEWLGRHGNFKSHGRHIARGELKQHELKIVPLEDDQTLQELVLSVFHATTHTFDHTSAVKIIENHKGKAFIKQANAIAVGPGGGQALPPGAGAPQFPPGPGGRPGGPGIAGPSTGPKPPGRKQQRR